MGGPAANRNSLTTVSCYDDGQRTDDSTFTSTKADFGQIEKQGPRKRPMHDRHVAISTETGSQGTAAALARTVLGEERTIEACMTISPYEDGDVAVAVAPGCDASGTRATTYSASWLARLLDPIVNDICRLSAALIASIPPHCNSDNDDEHVRQRHHRDLAEAWNALGLVRWHVQNDYEAAERCWATAWCLTTDNNAWIRATTLADWAAARNIHNAADSLTVVALYVEALSALTLLDEQDDDEQENCSLSQQNHQMANNSTERRGVLGGRTGMLRWSISKQLARLQRR